MTGQEIFYSEIERAVMAHYRIARQQLQNRKRDRKHFTPRAALVTLARRHTPLSLPQIGDKLHRDHTTILSAQRRAEFLLATDAGFCKSVAAIEAAITQPPALGFLPFTREMAIAAAWRTPGAVPANMLAN